MKDGFISVACGTPTLRLADCLYNAEQTIRIMQEAEEAGVKVLVLPEMGLTGYTCGDLFYQDVLLKTVEEALGKVLESTATLELVTAVGLPIRYNNLLYNAAAIIQKGSILGVVPKTHLPNYSEFYEKRQFASAPEVPGTIDLCGQSVFFSPKQLFACSEIPELVLGFEICEDLWVSDAPSVALAKAGATIIGNLSASNELIGKDKYRRELVKTQSAKLFCGYIYTSSGEGESTSDLVFGAHQMIAENGTLLAEKRFTNGLTISEIDVKRMAYERRRTQNLGDALPMYTQPFSLSVKETKLTRHFPPMPFVPEDQTDLAERCQEILMLASLGLKQRILHTNVKHAVIGLSGGLDSTLALLICGLTMKQLDRPMTDIVAVTMPAFGTTERTKNNAVILAEQMGVKLETIDISKTVLSHFEDIGHDPNDHSVTYENAQARERTQVLMDLSNKIGGLVIGTGDLSEMALGWSTYNGDHMSMYGVNCSIPKTLVRDLVHYVAQDNQDSDPELNHVLSDILNTPVSPELLPAENGTISQKTEDLIGPYELHDFFLYYLMRWGYSPSKIYRLAIYAHSDEYSAEEILNWLKIFYRRFFTQQFKRNCVPDGPKVGSVSLSPRGDWRMPSDAKWNLWQSELENLG